jgi:UPF0755 protein
MNRRKRTILLILTALLIIAVVYAFYLYNRSLDLGDRVVSIIIRPGDTFASVVEKLISEGVVGSRVMLTYPARITGVDKKLTPGRYDFTGRNSCRSVLDKLSRADFLKVKVTLPEGAPIWKVASIIADRLDLDSATVADANRDSAFLQSLNLPCLEGYLFPETYIFPWGISETEVVGALVDQFRAETDSIWPDSIQHGLSRHETVILASIVEAETRLAHERGLVASVYVNRLRRDMKLDADPTVIYGLGGLDRPLYNKDLKKNTPYNTYLRKGLPPTPINSPGLAAIEAALHPHESNYLYFVADETGGHHFSRTNAEHNRTKRRIKALKNNW